MNKKILSIFLVLTILLVSLTLVSATKDIDDADNSLADKLAQDDNSVENTASKIVTESKTIKKNDKNDVQTKSATDTVTVKTYSQLVNTIKTSSSKNLTINLQKGTYKITETISLNKNLTLNGQNSVIDGQKKYQFIVLRGGSSLNVNNLTIQNTKTSLDTGGAISMSMPATLNVKNCKFINNVGTSTNGGAITNRGNTTILDCVFTNNTSIKSGAIYSGGENLNIYYSTFNKNIASSDSNVDKTAVIYVVGADNVRMTGNTFENNNGRSIHSYRNSKILINNTKFINTVLKTSNDIRGAILDNYESNMTLANSTFNNINTTTSKKNNGIIYHEIGVCNLLNNRFTNINTKSTASSMQGGIIFIRNATSTLTDNTFANSINSNTVRGGAIYINMGKVTATNNFFKTRVVGNNVRGGAIYVDNEATLYEGGNVFNNTVTGTGLINRTIFVLGKLYHINVKQNVDVKVNDMSIVYGGNVMFTATVTSKSGLVNEGNVLFKVNGVTLTSSNNKAIYVPVKNGRATLNYTVPASWSKTNYTLVAKFRDSANFNDKLSADAHITMIKRNATLSLTITPSGGAMDDVVTLTAKVHDSIPVNTGLVIFKFHGQTIRDNNGSQVKVLVKNGVASYKFTLPHGISAKDYVISTVYSNIRYNRLDANATLNGKKANMTVTLNKVTSNSRTIRITGKLTDLKGHNVRGDTYCSVKIGNTVLTNNSKPIYHSVSNGIVDIGLVVPDTISAGSYTLVLIANERNSYNGARGNTTLTFS